ncbi:MAG TPA: M14 family metallopeptidase [Bacteroidales bacterium]|nr:M14 family metallopeptidase [Bacteroidales bacterium]
MKRFFFTLILSLSITFGTFSQLTVPKPSEFFGFVPGSDRNVFTYEQLIAYLQKLDNASDRLEMRKIGESPMGKPMYIAFISMPGNIKNLDSLKHINQSLALDPGLSDAQLSRLTSEGRVFVLATLSMHSSEVGPSQASPLIAYDLCTTNDPEKRKWLSEIVYMIVPCHNPDGMDMVVNYYNKTKDTRYEGASLPSVYHKYVGHDNNRDFVMLTQEDTRAIASITNLEWFPQIMVEKHQMGMTGTRYFVPPNHDPIAENIDEGIWTRMGIFGANLMNDMTSAGEAGVSQNFLFDNYWPGSTETCIWKNVVGFLTECASAKVATPVYVEPNEIQVAGKGLAEYKKSSNMPMVWKGGWWKLSDIVNYEITSTNSILKTAWANSQDILNYRNEVCRKEVKLGQTTAPYYYVLPLEQHDEAEIVSFIKLMKLQGIKVYQLTSGLEDGNNRYSKGDIVIPLAQPFRAFILEVMGKQTFPERHYVPGGSVIKPYDITSWSIPLHSGLKSYKIDNLPAGIDQKLAEIDAGYNLKKADNYDNFMVFTVNSNESYKAAFAAMADHFETGRTAADTVINGKPFPAGSFVIKSPGKEKCDAYLAEFDVSPMFSSWKPATTELRLPSVALLETYMHDMDAGWTRFIFDTYHIPFKVIHPGEIQETDLDDFDIIVIPDNDKSILLSGKYKRGDDYYVTSYAPEFTKGMEKEGLQKILKYVNDGGTVVSWGGSADLFNGPLSYNSDKDEKEEFQFPIRDISDQLKKKGLVCPGTLIKMKLAAGNPLTAGMPSETGIFYQGGPVFVSSVPFFDIDRRVIGTVPENGVVMSGYCEKPELLANNTLMIWLKKGKGQLILMGFKPQFRASTHATYKLLFNSLLLSEPGTKTM